MGLSKSWRPTNGDCNDGVVPSDESNTYGLEVTHVAPFYLKMMGHNALFSLDKRRYAHLVRLGSRITNAEVTQLLSPRGWRTEVMGAWFSLARPATEVRAPLLDALARSQGSLTAPPLTVASAIAAGPEAASALRTYLAFDLANNAGSAGFVAAALEDLTGVAPISVSVEQRSDYTSLLDFAATLRDSFLNPPSGLLHNGAWWRLTDDFVTPSLLRIRSGWR